jgi:phosphopantothenoylcysteine synthetase/decarboxylase
MEPDFKNKRIVLGVCGSIAAFKAAEIASALTQSGALVDAVLTKNAQRFIAPLTFAALTRREVVAGLWDEDRAGKPMHIDLADAADAALVAPTSANLLAKMAHGFADDALTCVLLATRAPIVLAPAMNGNMWSHSTTQANVKKLREAGVRIVEPAQGMQACGYEGKGRLAELTDILNGLRVVLSSGQVRV